MKAYQGHRSWNAWNVSLWIGNDESLYRFAMECLKEARAALARRIEKHGENAAKYFNVERCAAGKFMRDMEGQRTPDGGRYNRLAVREALTGLE